MTLRGTPLSVLMRRDTSQHHWLSRYSEHSPSTSPRLCVCTSHWRGRWNGALVSGRGILMVAFFQDRLPDWSLPIKAMITSLPLWAILLFHFCEYWTLQIVMTYMPTYISSMLQTNVRDVSTETVHLALPFQSFVIQFSLLSVVTGSELRSRSPGGECNLGNLCSDCS